MSERPALELRDIVRHFGEVMALQGANLIVRRGTVHALLGENGAGKTTLMRVAYGMLRPTSGDVLVDGAVRRFSSPADAIAAGIGMVQQHPANIGAMTVWENVLLGGSGVLDPTASRNDIRALAKRLGFALDPDAFAADLPVASQQRLEILTAIHRDARLLILDEPTAILAPEEAEGLYRWLRAFADDGGTAVVVTHKLDEARRFTDELTVLRAGKTVRQATSCDATAGELTRAMIGEALAPPASRKGATPGDSVLRADRLHLLDSRGLAVVRDASFDVRAGEIVGIAGIEGSGHHQLLLALAGRHPLHSGSLQAPLSVSFVPEDRHRDAIVRDFTLTENSAVAGAGTRRGRIPWRHLAARTQALIEHFDVRAPGPSAPIRDLSGGNQQKFVLARELSGDPQAIVAENPTRGLDVRAAGFVREQLQAARDRGAAVVVYSSDLDELLELADRVLVVHAGSVVAVPSDRERIGAAMLGAA